MKNLKSFAVMLLVVVAAACGGGGGVSGPSQSGDSSARATMSVEVWQGSPGCSGPGCDGPASKLSPNADGTYTVQTDRKHALKLIFSHPGISGRRIQGDIIASLQIFGGQDKVSTGFNESSPSGVLGYTSEFTVWGGSGAAQVNLMLRFTESGADMGSPSPLNQDIVMKTVPRQG